MQLAIWFNSWLLLDIACLLATKNLLPLTDGQELRTPSIKLLHVPEQRAPISPFCKESSQVETALYAFVAAVH